MTCVEEDDDTILSTASAERAVSYNKAGNVVAVIS